MTAMNWSGCNGHGMAAHGGQAFAFLVSSLYPSAFLPASRINAINLCVVGDERVQPENLDHEKSVDRFSGSPSRRCVVHSSDG